MPRTAVVLFLIALGLLGGCSGISTDSAVDDPAGSESVPDSGSEPVPDSVPDSRSESVPDSVSESVSDPPTANADGADGPAEMAGIGDCPTFEAEVTGTVARADLTETSGLVRSSSDPDLLWAVNDSGNEPGLFAVGLDGSDRGFFPLVDAVGNPVAAVDIEDLGRLGDTIYLADIGDNDALRDVVTIFVVEEPEPSVAGPAVVRQQIRLRYPDGARDAEAFVVDPLTGELIILGKDLWNTATPVFAAAPPFGQDAEVALTEVGSLDLSGLASTSTNQPLAGVLFPYAVTAADIDRSGTTIAIRTYSTVWLFSRHAGDGDQAAESILDAFQRRPCEGGSAMESQGEALAILGTLDLVGGGGADGSAGAYVTISEGVDQPVNRFGR